jgi:hypothetical protein
MPRLFRSAPTPDHPRARRRLACHIRRSHRHEAAGLPWGCSLGERVDHLRCTVEELELLRRTPEGRPRRGAFAPVVAGPRGPVTVRIVEFRDGVRRP